MSEKHTRTVELSYPRLANDPDMSDVCNIVDTIEVGLEDVRAARDIRIQYDFDRDGYVITAQKWDSDYDSPWLEVGFVVGSDGEESL